MLSTIDRLREDLDKIETQLSALVKSAPVHPFSQNIGRFVVVGAPDFYFAGPVGEQLRLQLSVKTAYSDWYERFGLLFAVRSSEAQKRIDAAHRELTDWIELGQNNFSVTLNQEANAAAAGSAVRAFRELLSVRDSADQEIIVVPDTNALTTVADPAAYEEIAGGLDFTFLLLPTVLAELDNLKVMARDPGYRQKVEGVVRRIKGWRKQGSLSEGVTVQKSIRVRAVAQEPSFKTTLSWLESTNADDRIIASVLEVQSASPWASVILVTGDINLQNKADAARLVCAEPPTSPQSQAV